MAGTMYYEVPVKIEEDKEEGVFRVTSPALSELITEGATFKEALDNARDALIAVFEIYEELGRPLPSSIVEHDERQMAHGGIDTHMLAAG